ncbi:hypothetical protein ABTY53_15605 [Streptomyces noursei]|uniref:hypothetical protein n=1 Tax=Streptomyces noursei TaxID=1971 RepID=UPI0033337F37
MSREGARGAVAARATRRERVAPQLQTSENEEIACMKTCDLATVAKPHLVQHLLEVIEAAPIAQAPTYLLVTVGVMVCRIAALGITYHHLVVSDQATSECHDEIHTALQEEGVERWRDSVVEIVHAGRPHRFFPGSTESTLYVIHPKVSQ